MSFVACLPPEVAQLPLFDFTEASTSDERPKQKKKIADTLGKIRQLHEELNTELATMPSQRPGIHSPADAAKIIQCFIGPLDHEEFWVMNIDTRNRVMSLVALYKGSINSAQIRVAEVFRQAIIDNAPNILIAHNHPSGDTGPSSEDLMVTRSIVQAGKLLDVTVLDHVIVSSFQFTSLKERGLGF